MMTVAGGVPEISSAALTEFYEKHFTQDSRNHFAAHFLGPVEEADEDNEHEDEDGLGYYADGVKRTLTDDQIAIFRHSEIQTLLRDRRHAEEAALSESPAAPSTLEFEATSIEDGEVEDAIARPQTQAPDTTAQPTTAPLSKDRKLSKKQRKAQYAKNKGFFNYQIKPDLRKRTWDKVDAGMDSLTYDEDNSTATMTGVASQRRRITYDDD